MIHRLATARGLSWLLAGIAIALLSAVLSGPAPAQEASQIVYVVELPDGGAVLACGLKYRLQGVTTRLIEMVPCPCPEPLPAPADRIFASSFELCP